MVASRGWSGPPCPDRCRGIDSDANTRPRVGEGDAATDCVAKTKLVVAIEAARGAKTGEPDAGTRQQPIGGDGSGLIAEVTVDHSPGSASGDVDQRGRPPEEPKLRAQSRAKGLGLAGAHAFADGQAGERNKPSGQLIAL